MKKIYAVTFVTLLFVCATQAELYTDWTSEYTGTEPNTVALWNFNEDQIQVDTYTIAKELVSGLFWPEGAILSFVPGTSASFGNGGKFGWGLNIPHVDTSGSDWAEVQNTGMFPSGSDPSLSVETWVKFNRLDITYFQYIIDKMLTDNAGYTLLVYREPEWPVNYVRLVWAVGDGTQKIYAASEVTLQVGQWYHLAGTWDATSDTAHLYLDADEIAATVSDGSVIENSTNRWLRFGERLASSYSSLDGVMDGVRISDKAYGFGAPYAPTVCGDPGTVYLAEDLNQDCKVDFGDFAQIASVWLQCTDPADTACDSYWK